MNSKAIVAVIVVAVAVVAGALLLGQGGPLGNNMEPGEVSDSSPDDNEGKVVFSVTDVAANMENVSEVYLKVDGVSLRGEGDQWVSADLNNDEFMLLELNASGDWQLLSSANMEAGIYNQIRLAVDSVEVETTDGTRVEANLPSDVLRMNGRVDVSDGEVASLNMDFMADQSLHVTGEGEYIFAPVVRLESRSGAAVSVEADGRVQVSDGSVQFNNALGMDLEGDMRAGFSLDSGMSLMLENGVIKLDVSPGSGADVDVGVGAGATSSDDDDSIEGGVDVEAGAGAGVDVQ